MLARRQHMSGVRVMLHSRRKVTAGKGYGLTFVHFLFSVFVLSSLLARWHLGPGASVHKEWVMIMGNEDQAL
jgi:hypothetical protein